MGVPTWMISEELLGETPHLKFEHAKWLCLEMRHPFDLLVNHHYPCYSMLKPPFFCGEIHHFADTPSHAAMTGLPPSSAMMPMVTPWIHGAKEDPFVLAFDNFLNSKEPPKHRGCKMVERWH